MNNEIDPKKRITVLEALQSPYFDDVRNEACQIMSEQKMVFSYEAILQETQMNEKKLLRQFIFKEALLFASVI